MHDYELYWKDKEMHEFGYGALRAKNLAEEIAVGWTCQTDLSGFDQKLTACALECFGVMIQSGLAETHHDEFARNTIALCCRNLSWTMLEEEESGLGYDETVLAAQALVVFSGWLQSRLDKPPSPAMTA